MTGVRSVPWASILLILAVWILSHLFFSAQIFLLPLSVLSAFLLSAAAVIHGVRWLLRREPERLARLKGALLQVLLAAVAVTGVVLGSRHLFRRVERTMQPVIDAAEAFHAKTGGYPRSAEEMVPAYLLRIPMCPGNGKRPMYLHKQPGDSPFPGFAVGRDGYSITCYTVVFWKYTYDSEKRRWFGWD